MLKTATNSLRSGPNADLMPDAYERATGHSFRVRRLKILLPLIAILIGAAFVAVSFIRTYLPEELEIENATIENGKIVMSNPAISGRNDQGISYSMKANRALQDVASPDMITLEQIIAKMPVKDDVTALVTAQSGIYNRARNQLQLDKPFTLDLSNGLKATFQSAYLDVPAGEMSSKTPVKITTGDASIVAQSLRMTDKGRNIVFEGAVRVNVSPAAIRKTE